MARNLPALILLLAVSVLVGCKPSKDKATQKEGCGVAAPDFTSVSLSPKDMATHAPRRIVWDDAERKAVAGHVDLQVRFHNHARPPSDEEIEETLSRTELLRWPEAESIEFKIERSRMRTRTTSTVAIIPAEDLPNGWYALRIAEASGSVAEDTDPQSLGRGRLSRFHVGSCPLVLGIESLGDSGRTRLLLSETLNSASLESLGIASLDGTQNCVPRFSVSGPLSPGKRLDFDCDFEPAATGAKVTRDPSSPVLVPERAEFLPEDFRESKDRIKTTQFELAAAEPMPNCKR